MASAPPAPTPATSPVTVSTAWSSPLWNSRRSPPKILSAASPKLPNSANSPPTSISTTKTSTRSLAPIASTTPAAPPHPGHLPAALVPSHEAVSSPPGPDRIDYARRAEKAALDFDPRIKNSEGGSFDAATGHKVLANSHGFVGEYRRSYCSVSAVPIAQTEDGAMQRDYWFSVARNLGRLESPEHVGTVAAQRTLRRLGARKGKTAHVPVVLDPLVA